MRELVERWRARRALRRFAPLHPGSPEGSAVRVSGIVRVLAETVAAPLSGIDGVIVRTSVKGASRFKGSNPRPWTEDLIIKPFVVAIAQRSQVIVDGSHVVLGIPRVEMSRVTRERKQAFLVREALNWPASFDETVLAPDTRITVGGVLLRDIAHEAPHDERAFRELTAGVRLVGSAEHPLVILAA